MVENSENIKNTTQDVSPSKVTQADFSEKIQKLTKNFSEYFSKKEGVGKKEDPVKKDTKPGAHGEQTEKLFQVSDLTSNFTPKKALKILAAVLLLVMIIAALYVRFIRTTPVRNIPTVINVPTPTYSPYQKYKPSIYAEDVNFKRLDEGVRVLENEVKNSPLEEKTLLPPGLDFNVDFK